MDFLDICLRRISALQTQPPTLNVALRPRPATPGYASSGSGTVRRVTAPLFAGRRFRGRSTGQPLTFSAFCESLIRQDGDGCALSRAIRLSMKWVNTFSATLDRGVPHEHGWTRTNNACRFGEPLTIRVHALKGSTERTFHVVKELALLRRAPVGA